MMIASQPIGSNDIVIRPAAVACRHCGEPLRHTFVDLGNSPLCETFLRADQLNEMEPFYPLKVCSCVFVQPRSAYSENIFTSARISPRWTRGLRT